jgi:hypothetical protein
VGISAFAGVTRHLFTAVHLVNVVTRQDSPPSLAGPWQVVAVGSGRARGVSGQGGVIGSSPSPPVAAPRTLAPSCIVRPWTADHAGHAGSRVDLRDAAGGGTFIPWCAGRMPPACRSRCQKPAPASCIRGGAPTCARASVRARGRERGAQKRQTPSASRSRGGGCTRGGAGSSPVAPSRQGDAAPSYPRGPGRARGRARGRRAGSFARASGEARGGRGEGARGGG